MDDDGGIRNNSAGTTETDPSPCQESGFAPSPCACVAMLLRARPSDSALAGLGCRVMLALCGSGDQHPHAEGITATNGSTGGGSGSNIGSTTAAARLGEVGVCEALVLVMRHQRENAAVVTLACRAANHLVGEDQDNSNRWGRATGCAVLVDAIDTHPLNAEVGMTLTYT